MVEKVLGFEKKNDYVCGHKVQTTYNPKKDKIVPVVSVEWMEYIVKRKKYLEAPSVGNQEWVVNVEKLLKAVRLQAKREAKP